MTAGHARVRLASSGSLARPPTAGMGLGVSRGSQKVARIRPGRGLSGPLPLSRATS